jgi:hypothetical protein
VAEWAGQGKTPGRAARGVRLGLGGLEGGGRGGEGGAGAVEQDLLWCEV